MDYSAYFRMDIADAIDYAKTRLHFFEEEESVECKEIGDGNLNYVFRLENGKKSLIIKQAGPVARISDEFHLSTDRNRIEYEILKRQYELSGGLVPEVYSYDAVMNCTAMEDLSDYKILRTAMMEHEEFDCLADQISTFLVKTLLLTSDLCVEHKEKKDLVKRYISPELCEISEDLVYTEPFSNNKNRNDVLPENQEFVEKVLYNDETLLLETAKLKFNFMTNAQAIIHGDLHSGSIFIKEDEIRVFDPEFAFYGPMGYDVGNVIANLMFAWSNSLVLGYNSHKEWLEVTMEAIIDLFIEKFNIEYDKFVIESTAKYSGFKEYYLDMVLCDTAAVVGLEGIRRIVGMAHVKDITTIEDINLRVKAERICILAGKQFILNRETYKTGKDFVKEMKLAAAIFR